MGTYVFARPKRSDPQQLERTAPPEQYEGGAELASAKELVHSATCSFNSCGEQSHKDSVGEATVENK